MTTFREYSKNISEGIFDSKQVKKLKELYTNFNNVESGLLKVLNSSNGAKSVGGGRGTGGYEDMVHATENNIDGMKLAKTNSERIKKINKLAEEIYVIHNDMKQDLNDFFESKYPEEMKKLG